MTTEVKWSVAGDYYQACSCDYGCPCEFEAPPTQGFCEDVSVWRIDQGKGASGEVPVPVAAQRRGRCLPDS